VSRTVAALILVAVGCHGARSGNRLRANFSDGSAPIDTPSVDCTYDTVDQLLSCAGIEGMAGLGREVDISIFGGPVAHQSYTVGPTAKPYATVALLDARVADLASGPPQWSGVDGGVAVSIWDGTRVAFSYSATLRSSDMTATTFTLSGDVTVLNVQTLR
jgi:hypothetical protein